MSSSLAAKWLLRVVIIVAIIGGAGAVRFYWTAPELRVASQEIIWQCLPYLLIILLSMAVLMKGSAGPR